MVISSDYTTKPRAIAVYPAKGLLFWTDHDVVDKLHKSAMDGSDRRTLPANMGKGIVGITIDYEEDKVYYVEDFLNAVWRMDLDGGKNALSFCLWFWKWRGLMGFSAEFEM